jgi:hypothetical protein
VFGIRGRVKSEQVLAGTLVVLETGKETPLIVIYVMVMRKAETETMDCLGYRKYVVKLTGHYL